MPVLVAYATRHGATREIAEAVAASLREGGLEADALPAKGVRSPDGYTAVVLGAPLYMFHLHADARRYLSRHRRALERMPVAVFAGGPYGEAGEGGMARGARLSRQGVGPVRLALAGICRGGRWQVRPHHAALPVELATSPQGDAGL